MDPFVSVDFETYYDKEYSLSEMSTWEYVFHEKFDAYMVAIYCEDIKFVGHPKDFDWGLLKNRTVIHHNASFDGLVVKRLQRDGVIPADLQLAGMVDTADLAAYLKVMRNLKTASKYLLGIEVSKAAREGAKGKKSSELMSDPVMLEYALSDAKNAYEIWVKYSDKWPEDERLISSWNREAGWKGVYVDQEYLDWAIEQISGIRFEAEKLIPWKNWRETHKTPLSAAQIRLGCRDAGIPCPSSFAKDSEECEAWEDEYGPKFPWIAALRDWRRSNTFLTKLLTIRQRVRDDGTMPYGIKYFGAHSGRMSSDGGVNLLNLEKFPKFAEQIAPYKGETKRGVDIRRVFVARPGKVLYLADLAQIEARVINLLCGNFAFLEACKTMSPYEAHARTSMGWKGGDLKKENPKLYALAKARCFSGDTLVLTDSGYRPISTITVADMVWDGVSFVSHDGVIQSGVEKTIWVSGDRPTNDHKLFISEKETVPAGDAWERQSELERFRRESASRNDVWELAAALARVLQECGRNALVLCSLRMHGMWERVQGKLFELTSGKNKELRHLRQQADSRAARPTPVGEKT